MKNLENMRQVETFLTLLESARTGIVYKESKSRDSSQHLLSELQTVNISEKIFSSQAYHKRYYLSYKRSVTYPKVKIEVFLAFSQVNYW
jgi:hypothetical protein